MTYDLSKAKERFVNDLFATDVTGIEIIDVGELYAKCTLVLQPKHLNAMGAVMGGVIYTLADFAFAVAANYDTLDMVSISGDIKFLSSTNGNVLYAEARCIKKGRRNSFFDIDVTDNNGKLVAKISILGAKILNV